MWRYIVLVCVLGSTLWGCSQSSDEQAAKSGSAADSEESETSYGDFAIGEPVAHENLTIFPIASKAPKNEDRFITLDEGLAAGTVKIIEVGATEAQNESAGESADDIFGAPLLPDEIESDASGEADEADGTVQEDGEQTVEPNPFGSSEEPELQSQTDETDEDESQPFGDEVDGEVNTLLVLNTSGKPLYLMPGEVISGGKQDRTIGQEVVIASSEASVPVDVFCVEQGRWHGRSVESTAGYLAAAVEPTGNLSLVISATQSVNELAEDSRQGKFVASVGQLNKDARLAVQQAGEQGKVWEEVAKTNSKVGNDSSSDNFAANYMSAEFAKDFEPYIEKLKPVGDTKQIVGVAVAVNGKMLSVDVFESTPLFRKFWPKLLKSYALDAVAATSGEAADEKLKPVSVQDCIAFLKGIEEGTTETEELAGGQKLARRKSSQGTSFSFYDATAAEAVGVAAEEEAWGYGGGFDGGVHTGVLAH